MNELTPEIIKLAAEGHLPSFEKVFRSSSPSVYSLAFRMLQQHEDAEEITQSVFLTLFEGLRTFRFDSSLQTWIHRITVNAALNFIKKVTREREKARQFAAEVPPATESATDLALEKESRLVLIRDLLESLPIDYRVCLVLRSFEGMKYQEIADILQLNLNTVKARLKRAREMLLARKMEMSHDEL